MVFAAIVLSDCHNQHVELFEYIVAVSAPLE